MKFGVLYLIPLPIHPTDEFQPNLTPPIIKEHISKLNHFAVENIRTARRYIKKIEPNFNIDNTFFEVLNKKSNPSVTHKIIGEIKNGRSYGLMSEAGCPGIADPGKILCDIAHQQNIKIKPLIGPCSITMALMASGLNGQNFAFHGYLPIQQKERINEIKKLSKKIGAHIFIETPYRNEKLIKDLLLHLDGEKKLCIATNLTGFNEYINTKTVKEWKEVKFNINKQPTIFIFE